MPQQKHTLTVHVTDHNNSWSLLINNTHFWAQGKANLQNRDEAWGINEVDMYCGFNITLEVSFIFFLFI